MKAFVAIAVVALVASAAALPQGGRDEVRAVVVKSVSSVVPQYQQVEQQSVFGNVRGLVNPVFGQQVYKQEVEQPSSVLFRSVEQEIPAVSTVRNVQNVQNVVSGVHYVNQPVYSQVASRSAFAGVPQQFAQYKSVNQYSAVPQQFGQYKAVNQYSAVPQQFAQYKSVNQYSALPQQFGQYKAVNQYSALPQHFNQYKSVDQYATHLAEPKIKILKQEQEIDPSGIYSVNFETENGILATEHGTVKDINDKEGPVAAKEGSYSYVGDDGQTYTVNWVADEFGFRASGAHLPQAPAIPEEIQRSLDLIASQPQKFDDNGNPITTLTAARVQQVQL